jgi:hypothetical protein
MTRPFRAAALVCALSTGCFANVIRGSGHKVRESREMPAFDGVQVRSGMRATVEIGPRGPIEIEADDNLMPLIETQVADGRLEIRFRRMSNVWSSGEVRVKVRAPAIRYLGASGGSEIRAELEPVDDLEIEASGGAEVHARGIDAAELSASGSGGSHLDLAGTARKVTLHMSGGTDVKAARLAARSVRVSGSGGSTAEIRASDSIRGELSGGTDVHLIGNASSRVSTSGGSSVDYDE